MNEDERYEVRSTPPLARHPSAQGRHGSIQTRNKVLGGDGDAHPAPAECRHELSTWRDTFDKLAVAGRQSGRKAFGNAVAATAQEPASEFFDAVEDADDVLRDLEAEAAERFVKGVGRKISEAPIWALTRALIVDPLWPAARARIRAEFHKGFYEGLALFEAEVAGRC